MMQFVRKSILSVIISLFFLMTSSHLCQNTKEIHWVPIRIPKKESPTKITDVRQISIKLLPFLKSERRKRIPFDFFLLHQVLIGHMYHKSTSKIGLTYQKNSKIGSVSVLFELVEIER